jgi:Helix-turn-helix domain
MSIRVMSLVWDNFNRGGSEKLVMLAMADWCNDEGGSLHPAVSTVAKKTNISDKQARRILHTLIDDGYLDVIANFNGGDKGQSRQYKLNLEKISTPPVDVSPPINVTPPTSGSTPLPSVGVHPSHAGEYTPPIGGSQSIIYPLTINQHNHHSVDDGFEEFWNRYPKKVGKTLAHQAWKKEKVNVDEVLETLKWQIQSEQWNKQSGQFIPNPTTYINQGRWHDEPNAESLGSPF